MRIYKSNLGDVLCPEIGVWQFVWSNPYNVSDSKPCATDAATGETFTRGHIRQEAQRLAHALVHSFGLHQGDVVSAISPNTIHYYILVLACQCAGLVFTGANAAYTAPELAHQLENADVKVLFVHPALTAVAEEAAGISKWSGDKIKKNIIYAVSRKNAGKAAPRKAYDELLSDKLLEPVIIKDVKNTVAFIGFSSGTTSAPKGVMTTHYNMTSVISGLGVLQGHHTDVLISLLPFNHIYGLTKLIHWPIFLGASSHVMPKFELKLFLETVQRHKVTTAFLVPPIVLALAKEPIVDNYDVSSLKLTLSGAAPLSASLQSECEKRLKIIICGGYGSTETSPTSHVVPPGVSRPGSCGLLLPNLESRLIDPETGKDVPVGQDGELWVRGPIVMKGYLKNEEATRSSMHDGFYKTGDVAHIDDEGYYYITDRIKELIKYKGLQVYPAELEGVLVSHPKIRDAGVISVYSEEEATELPRGYVVPSEKIRDPEAFEQEIQAYIKNKLSNHKQLRGGIIILEEIPKSPSGKILRRVLKDRKDPPPKRTRRAAKL